MSGELEQAKQGHEPQALSAERVAAFSDGVLAIAGTLLAFNIKAPADLHVPLLTLLAHLYLPIQAYFISFAVVGVYWRNHHRLFGMLARVDSALVSLNLVFLALICLLPFATSLISTDNPSSATVSFYAGTVALIGLAQAAIWVKAVHTPNLLVPPGLDLDSRIRYRLRFLTPIYFLLSIIVAQFNPVLAMMSWVGLTIVLPSARNLTRSLMTKKS